MSKIPENGRVRTAGSERKFGLSVGGVLLGLGAILLQRHHETAATILGVPGGLLVLGGLFVPNWLGPVERRWMWVAGRVGHFNARVILGVAYYVIISPMGLFMRLLGRDPLDRRLRTGESYWHKRPPEPAPSRERYVRQF